jgi:hypothetical protein
LESKKYNTIIEVLKENENVTDFEYTKLSTKVGRSYPRVITFKVKNLTHKVLFIRHPSSFFSWKKWGTIISDNISFN